VLLSPCRECRGQGRTRHKKNVLVKVPAGVDSGTRLRLRGEGEGGYRGGPAGDLYVRIEVAQHPSIERDGDNLYSKISISFVQAIVGDTVELPTLNGAKSMEIKPGTQPGSVVRFPGEGVPKLRGYGRGDLFVEVEVRIPRDITPRQEELLHEFMELDREKGEHKGKKWPWGRRKQSEKGTVPNAQSEIGPS
jgi:molecular chaperone DnaJ